MIIDARFLFVRLGSLRAWCNYYHTMRGKISPWVKAGFSRREQKPLAAQGWACLEQPPSPNNY
jgi:hypothetical protein